MPFNTLREVSIAMLKRRAILVSVVLIVLALPFAFADGLFGQSSLDTQFAEYTYSSQLGIPEASVTIPSNTVLQAIGDSEYPVTPGDTFSLVYSSGKDLVSLTLQADNDCRVMIQSVGVVDAAGMSYKDFKAYVEDLISKYYTYSSPQLILKSCGVFSVKVTGEVSYSQYVTVWGLSRLSDLAAYANNYASTRSVQITYRDGSKTICDLFCALRNGSDENNPLLSPGCEVCFMKAESIVSLSGAIAKPGVYQMLEGETLSDLILVYGAGLLNTADSQSIMVSNYSNGAYVARYLTISEAKDYVPVNGDAVNVVYSAQKSTYVSVTGAIAASADKESISMANSLDYSFAEGETAGNLLSRIASIILSTADVSSAYVLRNGSRLPVDAVLQAGDNIIIPFSRQTVTVTGYVNNPGTFAFVPDMTADYYVSLAGGFSASSSGRVKVLDASGNKVKADNVPSGATIVANNNNFSKGLAITASVVSLVSSILVMITYGHTVLGYF